MMSNVTLSDFIEHVKAQIMASEDPKPPTGFWIGVQTVEITFETISEVLKGGGLKIYLFSAQGEKKDKTVQKIKINLVTQDLEP